MALWDDVRKAARDAHADRKALLVHLRDVKRRVFRQLARKPPDGPQTLTVDARGGVTPDREFQGLHLLGRSLLLLAASAAAMGLSWLTTWLLGIYLFLQRLLGLRRGIGDKREGGGGHLMSAISLRCERCKNRTIAGPACFAVKSTQ